MAAVQGEVKGHGRHLLEGAGGAAAAAAYVHRMVAVGTRCHLDLLFGSPPPGRGANGTVPRGHMGVGWGGGMGSHGWGGCHGDAKRRP